MILKKCCNFKIIVILIAKVVSFNMLLTKINVKVLWIEKHIDIIVVFKLVLSKLNKSFYKLNKQHINQSLLLAKNKSKLEILSISETYCWFFIENKKSLDKREVKK